MPRTAQRRRLAAVVAGAGSALLVVVLFLTALAAKERDDRFCVACHLHEAKFRRVGAAVPVDLAGAHGRAQPAVGCIGCHGGADLGMRLRVWQGAAFDTLRFLAGAYREPDHMRLPLRDADCRSCHTPIVKPLPVAPAPPAPTAAEETPFGMPPELTAGPVAFHRSRAHDTMTVTCVRCHVTHVTGGERSQRFIVDERVGPICRECHPRM